MNRRELLKGAGKLLAVFGLASQVDVQPESTTELFVDEGVRFSVSDALANIDPNEVPLLKMLGQQSEFPSVMYGAMPNRRLEWIDDDLTGETWVKSRGLDGTVEWVKT